MKNKTVFISGGSSGIGLSTAELFIKEGARVLISGRNSEKLNAIKKRLGEKLHIIKADVTKIEDTIQVKNYVEENFKKLDYIFANAGVASPNTLGATNNEDFDHIFNTNVKGVFFTVQNLLPLIKQGGSIILNASIVAHKGMANLSLYNASKAAVRSFSRTWANDLKEQGIRVNTVSPGVTDTPIFGKEMGMSKEDVNNFKESLKISAPAMRMGKPEEIAEAVLFLASEKSSYINGIELPVDGGFAQI